MNYFTRIIALMAVSCILLGAAFSQKTYEELIPLADIPLTAIGVPYLQDFDTLSNTAGTTTNVLAINGWAMTESGGGARDNELYAVDTGGSATGDTYSYGSAAATDRALGALRSGTLIPIFGASFVNNTGVTIQALHIIYTGEEWRLGTVGRTDQIDFQYSIDATSLTTGTWNDVDALDFVTPFTTTAGARDGNLAVNRTTIDDAIRSLSIPDGATFWIRWIDLDASGADDGLAVDDFSIAAVVPTAANSTLTGRVSDAAGYGVSNVIVTIEGGALAAPISTRSNSFGNYSFDALPTGHVYLVTVSSRRYSFGNPTQVVTVNNDVAGVDFTATVQH